MHPRIGIGHPGQAHGQQRGNGQRGQGSRHRPGQPDQAGPRQADDQERAAADAQRAQGAVLHRVEEAHPGQQLPQDEHADHREQPGHQPQRDGLQVDGTLRVHRLGGQRVALHVLAPGQPAQLALDGGHVGGPVPEPQRHPGVGVEARAVRPVEGGGRPDRVGARPGLRRELRGGRVDPDDPERQRHRQAGRSQQRGAQGVPDAQAGGLGQGEGDVHLIGPGRVRQAAGQDPAVPEPAGNHGVLRRDDLRRGR